MNKYILVFIVGVIETALYTGFLLALAKKQKFLAPTLMTVYMFIYLDLIATCIKNADTYALLAVYAISCGLGVLLRMKIEERLK
jgi:uncharacterized protein YebE (UPF0316 family)